jgi:hypothetical protein
MIREQNAWLVIWPYSVALKEQYSMAILVVVDKADINSRDEPIIGQKSCSQRSCLCPRAL